MRKRLEGSVTVEAAVVIPMVLFVFVVLVQVLFYYHDKNVLMGIVHETVSLGSGRETMDARELEEYFEEQVQGRMLVFKRVEKEIHLSDSEVKICCKGKANAMTVRVEYRMSRTVPENYIRNIRKLEKGVNN